MINAPRFCPCDKIEGYVRCFIIRGVPFNLFMAQNIGSAVPISDFLPEDPLRQGPVLYPSSVKSSDAGNQAEPKQKMPQDEPSVTHSGTLQSNSERNRYLDLFTQLGIIEESFEFVHLIFHFDPFQCVYAGSTFEKIDCRSCKEIYERTDLFYETAHPDDTDFLMKQIKTLLKNGYNEFTYRIITKQGEIKHLKVNAWCQQDESLSYVINCFQKDVTAQMKTKVGLQKSLQKQRILSDLAIMLNSVDDFEHKLQSVVDKIGDSCRAEQVSLYEINDERKQMTCRFVRIKQDDPIIASGAVIDIPPLRKIPEYINIFQYSAGDDVNGFMRSWNRPASVQSLVIVPVRIKQKIFGFIELLSVRENRPWTDDETGFVGTVGSMVANFYDRKAVNDELNLNYLKQELLANVSARLNKYVDDGEHVLKNVLEYIGLKKEDAERIFIYRYYEEENRFEKTHEYVRPSLNSKFGSSEKYDGLLFTEMLPSLKAGKPYRVDDIAQLNPELQVVFGQQNIRSILAVPMFVEGKFYGVYGYDVYSHFHTWKKVEIEIAQTFASTISHFIERQTIMKRLKNSEKKFKDISEELPGCVFRVSLLPSEEITINYVSPQFEQWTGTPLAQKVSLEKIQQAVHPNDYDLFSKIKKELKDSHAEISFEGRFYFSKIGFRWLIVKAKLSEVTLSGERIYNGLIFDATENKQTESKLAEANVSIQSIINNLETGVLLVDDMDNVLYVNERLLEMPISAGTFNAITDKPNRILNATYDLVKDNVALMNHTVDLMKNRAEERSKELFLYRSAEIVTRDYIPIFRDQRFFAHLFIFKNITRTKLQELEIQKAYKRVLTIIDYSDIGVLLLSENEKVLIVNERFLKIYRIDESASRFINQPFRVLWDRMTESVCMENLSLDLIRDAVHSGTRIINREFTINETDTLRCFVEPVVADEQILWDMHETLIQIIDITAQKNIEHALRKAKDEAEVIAKAKSHILTSMSHEIRTPLNGILGFSTMLKESLTDPYQREMAEVIDQSGHRLMDTLNAIIDFSVIQSEKKSFKISSVSVNKILREQINLYRSMALQKRLYLYAEVKGHIGIAVAEQVLYKILQNLINNAIKYTIRGGIKIEAGITPTNEGDLLDIKVIDTGVGIEEYMHKTIFEPFRQESEGNERAFEGAGLGLSLVKEYVQKTDGRIHLTSQKNKGSIFNILLPNAYCEDNDTSIEIIGIHSESIDPENIGHL